MDLKTKMVSKGSDLYGEIQCAWFSVKKQGKIDAKRLLTKYGVNYNGTCAPIACLDIITTFNYISSSQKDD